MNKRILYLSLLCAFGSLSSCFGFIHSNMEQRIEAPQKIKERLPLASSSSEHLLDQIHAEEALIDQDDQESLASNEVVKKKKHIAPQSKEMSSEEYALETLINMAQDIEQRINRSSFLPKLVAYKKEIDNDTNAKTEEKTKKLFEELAEDISIGIIHTTGSFIVNQSFYHFLGVKNVRSPANEIVTRGLEFAQLAGFSRSPSQIAAIALFLSNITNSLIDSCIRQAQFITLPLKEIIATHLTTPDTQKFILDNALFFDSSDLAHNLLEKILLSKGMNDALKDQLGLEDGHPLLWLHEHADMGIAGMRIYSLINDAKKQTYDFDIEKIFDGLENGSISTTEGIRIAQTLLSTMQEITGLLQRVTKSDAKDTEGVRALADSTLAKMRLIIQGLQGQISGLNRMGAITGLAALAGHPV